MCMGFNTNILCHTLLLSFYHIILLYYCLLTLLSYAICHTLLLSFNLLLLLSSCLLIITYCLGGVLVTLVRITGKGFNTIAILYYCLLIFYYLTVF
jgi:hypothetical protein